MYSDKKIGEAVAKGVIQRLVKVVKRKKVEGLLPALGSESMKFFALSPDIQLHDWGIMVEDLPTAQEREIFAQRLNMKDASGQITPEDYVLISTIPNLKQAGKLLAHRMKKREKEAREYELQKMQMNGKIQTDSAVAAEKAKQETLTLQFQLKGSLDLELKKMDMEMLRMKLGATQRVTETNVAGKITTQAISNEGKSNNSENNS
jgi:hypothetical protein